MNYKDLYRKALKKIGEMSDEQLEAFVSGETLEIPKRIKQIYPNAKDILKTVYEENHNRLEDGYQNFNSWLSYSFGRDLLHAMKLMTGEGVEERLREITKQSELEETNVCQYCGEEPATDKLNGRLIGDSCWNVYVSCNKTQWEQILTIMRNAEGQKRNS